MARVLIGCEFSGIVRSAFRKMGHEAFSCDLLPAEDASPYHYQEDLFHLLKRTRWDLLVQHWPCTNMAVSGARWFREKKVDQDRDVAAFIRLMNWPNIPHICGENPIGVLSTRYRKPDCIIQPHEHGHGEVKATCLWLKNLPELIPTRPVLGRDPRVHFASPGPNRWKERSRTLPGIARAMALQWGPLLGAPTLPVIYSFRCRK